MKHDLVHSCTSVAVIVTVMRKKLAMFLGVTRGNAFRLFPQ